MTDFEAPQSRNEALLQNILGAENELEAPQSRNEKILHAILGEDIPLDAPQSRIEELLLEIKEQGMGDDDFELVYITDEYSHNDIVSEQDYAQIQTMQNDPTNYFGIFVTNYDGVKYLIPIYSILNSPQSFMVVYCSSGDGSTHKLYAYAIIYNSTRKVEGPRITPPDSEAQYPASAFHIKVYRKKD